MNFNATFALLTAVYVILLPITAIVTIIEKIERLFEGQ